MRKTKPCTGCAKPIRDDARRVTTFCRACYGLASRSEKRRVESARHLFRKIEALPLEEPDDKLGLASAELLQALWREHPRILNHLGMNGSGNVYRSQAA